jgi:hypothetical protein
MCEILARLTTCGEFEVVNFGDQVGWGEGTQQQRGAGDVWASSAGNALESAGRAATAAFKASPGIIQSCEAGDPATETSCSSVHCPTEDSGRYLELSMVVCGWGPRQGSQDTRVLTPGSVGRLAVPRFCPQQAIVPTR